MWVDSHTLVDSNSQCLAGILYSANCATLLGRTNINALH